MKNGKKTSSAEVSVRALLMVTQLGLAVMTPVLLGAFLGIFIKRTAGKDLTLFFLVLGMLGGVRGAVSFILQLIKASREADSAARQAEKERRGMAEGASRPKTPSRIKKG